MHKFVVSAKNTFILLLNIKYAKVICIYVTACYRFWPLKRLKLKPAFGPYSHTGKFQFILIGSKSHMVITVGQFCPMHQCHQRCGPQTTRHRLFTVATTFWDSLPHFSNSNGPLYRQGQPNQSGPVGVEFPGELGAAFRKRKDDFAGTRLTNVLLSNSQSKFFGQKCYKRLHAKPPHVTCSWKIKCGSL